MTDDIDYFGNIGLIFRDKDLLRIEHVPSTSERIIGRDDELQNLADEIGSAIEGQKPNNVFLLGKPGTGKSLCTKFLTQQVKTLAKENNISIGVSYVDCMQNSTETQVIVTAGEDINTQQKSGVYFPSGGVAKSELYNRLWAAFETQYDVGIIILDEIDKLETPNSTLGTLSRAGESEKLTNCSLGVIGISNKPRFEKRLRSEVQSSLTHNELVFPPYNIDELYHILEGRVDAFQEGVLPDETRENVLVRAAKFAAKEYGDARQAINILRTAGELAQKHGDTQITPTHVEDAFEKAAEDKLIKVMKKQPYHSRIVLKSVALNTQSKNPKDDVKSHDVYSKYNQICEYESESSLSWRRVRDLLDELEDLEVLEQQRKGAGRGKGGYRAVYLIDSPDTVIKACKTI